MTNIIELKNVSKNYYKKNSIKVLKKINFVFEKGKIYSITGPSGSGKSTLLNLISLIDEPTSGSIKIDETIINYDKKTINDKIELPYHWTGVDLLAKHTNNKLFVIKDANVYFIDDFNTSYEISDLYPNIESKKYKGIIQYGNQTLFYYKDKVITYNNTNKTSKITSLPRDIPKDYSRVFQFYLEPEPVIIFIRNGHYFRFNPVTETVINKVGIKFNGYFPVKSKLIHFSSLGNKGLFGPRSNDILKTKEDVVIRDGIQTLTITENNEYCTFLWKTIRC